MQNYSDFIIHFVTIFVCFHFQGIYSFYLGCRICWHILDFLMLYNRALKHYLLFFNLFSFCSSDYLYWSIFSHLPSFNLLLLWLSPFWYYFYLVNFIFQILYFLLYSFHLDFQIASISLLKFKILILWEHIFFYAFVNNYHRYFRLLCKF